MAVGLPKFVKMREHKYKDYSPLFIYLYTFPMSTELGGGSLASGSWAPSALECLDIPCKQLVVDMSLRIPKVFHQLRTTGTGHPSSY